MSTLAPISQLTDEELSDLPPLPSMEVDAPEELDLTSGSKGDLPDYVEISVQSGQSLGQFMVAYLDARTGKRIFLEHNKKTIMTRAQIGEKSALPTLYFYNRFERKWVRVDGKYGSDKTYAQGIKVHEHDGGSRLIQVKSTYRSIDPLNV